MFLSEEDVKEEDIDESVIVHAGSCSLSAQPVAKATIKAFRIAHEKEKIVSFDVNYRNLMWKDDESACTDAVMEILKYVDLLKISEEEVEMMGGEDALAGLMEENGISLLVETLGSNGAQAFFEGEIIKNAGYSVKAVDATGAGDAFWGGFLSSLRLQGVDNVEGLSKTVIEKAMEYGNASGCICVQGKGAIVSIPTREQIEDFIKKN